MPSLILRTGTFFDWQGAEKYREKNIGRREP
jgi:hypothetical protein